MSEHIVSRPELTAEYLRSILHYDPETGVFTRLKAGRGVTAIGGTAGARMSNGYRNISVMNRRYLAHRLAWLYVYDSWPETQIDHVNRDRSDNRILNLREATPRQNGQNKGMLISNTSGYAGVSWHRLRSKWRANIKHNRVQIHLGLFESIEDAVAARKAAEKLYWADTQIAEPAPV